MSKIPGVATLIPPPDRAAIQAQVLVITRDLLRELGNTGAIQALKGSASLESDLALGSIERVELISRLERSLGISLPESAVADAKTLDDIIGAVAGLTGSASAGIQAVEQSPAQSLVGTELNAEAIESRGEARSEPSALDLVSAAGRHEGSLFWRVLESIYGIYAAGVFLVWLVFAWLVLLVTPRGRPAARMTSMALRMYFRVIGCRVTMEGREHLDAHGAAIYVSNHTSYVDVLAVLALFHTNYHFVAKSEINHMLFIGTFLRKLGHFAFERSKLRARSRQAEQMEKALLQGESVFVFAEGTFTAQPGLRQFQLGAFRAAVKTGKPIVPVVLRGVRQLLRDETLLPKPSAISVIVCPPIFPSPTPNGREWAEVLRLRNETRRIISRLAGEPLL